jgi:hypothetical protein
MASDDREFIGLSGNSPIFNLVGGLYWITYSSHGGPLTLNGESPPLPTAPAGTPPTYDQAYRVFDVFRPSGVASCQCPAGRYLFQQVSGTADVSISQDQPPGGDNDVTGVGWWR